ncbi:MAG: DnaA regulatory inactivator Hda [Zoogloeaceae bacterium]|jgi:DnaA family protein|nr:DnaA regulatory inactivator Hda [Zoogloeaceae bacterium]
MRQLLLDLLPEFQPSLENFLESAGNAETLAALNQWLVAGNDFCFFLWGERGSGKSHLLAASGFTYGFVYVDAGLDADLASLPPENLPSGLAVDRVEALSATGQIALFNAFNRLKEAGGSLLAAAGDAPARLRLREDLRNRLGSGLIYRLVALSDTEKAAVLTRKAIERAMPLTPEVLEYLLARAPRDLPTLSALLAALDRSALEAKRPITLPLLRDLLRQTLAEPVSLES